jgi:hypothetical protein
MRKMEVKCYLREELVPNQEITDEIADASARTSGTATGNAVRFTFFRKPVISGDLHSLTDDDILGYAVVMSLQLPDGKARAYILESVIRVPTIWVTSKAGPPEMRRLTNYYVHCSRDFTTVVGTNSHNHSFQIRGCYFCQQNDLTHVCAHAALRVAVNSSSYAGPKLTNRMINKILAIDHSVGHRFGKYDKEPESQGVSVEQIDKVVKHIGYDVQIANFYANPAIDYAEFIYPLIESGCPVILGVFKPNVAHVVAVLGHTLNTDRWTPQARSGYGSLPTSPYISTSQWVDHFIVSDDNFGMYSTVPTEAIRNLLVPKYNANLHAGFAVGLVPKNVGFSGYAAEQVAVNALGKLIKGTMPTPANKWFAALKAISRPVCRTLLQTKTDYLKTMTDMTDAEGGKLSITELNTLNTVLPPLFWITEISVPDLYSGNKHKFGDIAVNANGTEAEYKNGEVLVLAWLPGLHWHGKGLKSGPAVWPVLSHVPLVRGSSDSSSTLEW